MPPKPAAKSSGKAPVVASPHAETSAQGAAPSTAEGNPTKKKKHRSGRRRKNRRQSFAAPSDTDVTESQPEQSSLANVPEHTSTTESHYFRANGNRRMSNTSLESEALLDHRELQHSRPRRPSISTSPYAARSSQQHLHHRRPTPSRHHSARANGDASRDQPRNRMSTEDSGDDDTPTDRTPLLPSAQRPAPTPRRSEGYGGLVDSGPGKTSGARSRKMSASSSLSARRRKNNIPRGPSSTSLPLNDYDVNNPPSVPGSPRFGGDDAFDEVMLPQFTGDKASAELQRSLHGPHSHEAIIDIDQDPDEPSISPTQGHRRKPTVSAGDDVCLPFDHMSEEDFMHAEDEAAHRIRRGRKRPWPDLSALEEWASEEKESKTMEGLAKKVNEPVLVGGRLRPQKVVWQREDEEAPFRWTYFNEELDSSLRSHTISGLQQLGLSFRELFIPDPPEIEDDSSDDDEDFASQFGGPDRSATPVNGYSRAGTRQPSVIDAKDRAEKILSGDNTGTNTPTIPAPHSQERPKKYGPRPVFWLDVLQPSYEEMRVISKAFGIHKLTAEDIMEQEAREKVELFRNYYFVNYRTFEQDEGSDEYMNPVNMYFVVFKGGVISFHFSQMPHPPNVRRRIRQLAEHQYTDSDWISYAIIDNITDAYAPIIEAIEAEVDSIDDEILRLHSKDPNSDEQAQKGAKPQSKSIDLYEKIASKVRSGDSDDGDSTTSAESSRDMLLRVGECRKRVMGLYRLLGNKADVIKGLAKRCNEQWQVAPRSDVGLYLGDIQDHIITMTGNLTHYENILSRAHSNYLAQINIRMNERAEQTNDVLGKLTVLGTIVLPMNIITGMWGMNVLVPGQDVDSLNWFWSITAGLICFGVLCFFIAKKVYMVV